MKTVAMVPIKLNNERAPGKNTRTFDDGTALVTHFLKTLVRVREFDAVYVFCSDASIEKYLVPGAVYLERPAFLDTKEATPQQIIEEFSRQVDADIYAVCHCTSPFVTAEHIGECVRAVKSGRYDSAFTAERIQRLLWTDGNEPLNFSPDNVPRTQDLRPIYSEVSAEYVFTRDVFETTRRRVGLKPYIMEVSGPECIDIDYPEDFEMANAVYMNMIRRRVGKGNVRTE